MKASIDGHLYNEEGRARESLYYGLLAAWVEAVGDRMKRKTGDDGGHQSTEKRRFQPGACLQL